MFAYVKEGKIIAVSESRLTKRVEPELVREIDEETEKVSEYWKPAVPGLIFDEEIETKLEGELDFVNGKVVKKIQSLEDVAEAMEEFLNEPETPPDPSVVGTEATPEDFLNVTVTG